MVKTIKILSTLGLIAMTTVLVYGFTVGDFSAEGTLLTSMPWGIVSLVDLYTGFILFCGWIFYREKSLVIAVLWSVAMLVLGFWAGSLYALIAAFSSRDNLRAFWLGKHAD